MYITGAVGHVAKRFSARWYYGCDGTALPGSADVSLFSPNGRCLVCFMSDDLGAGVSAETRFSRLFHVKMYVTCVSCGVIVNL